MSERKHADLWKELVDEAAEAEIDRAASVSVEQAEAELAAAGFDVAAERARANAFLEALERGESTASAPAPGSAPAPAPASAPAPAPAPAPASASAPPKRRTRPRDVVFRVTEVALSAAAGAALYAGLLQAPGPTANPSPSGTTSAPAAPSAADLALAADLRRQAAAACEAKQWSVCLAHLDKARAVDPGGDDTRTVKTVRDQAIAGILSQPR
jgi:hypothetical protein